MFDILFVAFCQDQYLHALISILLIVNPVLMKSVYPEQLASSETDRSGSTLFKKEYNALSTLVKYST